MSTAKYTTDLPEASLGEDGLAINDGWIVIYSADTRTREYLGANRDYIQSGVGLAAGAYLDAPELPKDKTKAVCRTEDGSAWEFLDDFRGKEMYDTQTRKAELVVDIGPVPEGWTLLKPEDNYAVWDGEKWTDDAEARRRDEVKKAEAERESRIQEAEKNINRLERVIKLGIATEEETASYEAWVNYSVVVYRINPEDTPDIVWPDRPE